MEPVAFFIHERKSRQEIFCRLFRQDFSNMFY